MDDWPRSCSAFGACHRRRGLQRSTSSTRRDGSNSRSHLLRLCLCAFFVLEVGSKACLKLLQLKFGPKAHCMTPCQRGSTVCFTRAWPQPRLSAKKASSTRLPSLQLTFSSLAPWLAMAEQEDAEEPCKVNLALEVRKPGCSQ